MPRPTTYSEKQIAERALEVFWVQGFNATSMDALVKSTGVSRQAIYSAFGGKAPLFHACFSRYQDLVVSPAFSIVEQPGADLDSVATYFETQIALAEASGLPGPGCFVANAATEVSPHDEGGQSKVAQHNDRLRSGFLNALTNVARPGTPPEALATLSETCVVFTNGVWSMSRVVSDAAALRRVVRTFLVMVRTELA